LSVFIYPRKFLYQQHILTGESSFFKGDFFMYLKAS